MKGGSLQQWECGGKKKYQDLLTAAALVLLCYTKVEEDKQCHKYNFSNIYCTPTLTTKKINEKEH